MSGCLILYIGARPSAPVKKKGRRQHENHWHQALILHRRGQVPNQRGEGHGSERIFVTDAKLNQWPYQPKVGDEVNVSYNRFGRCDGMAKA